MAIEELKKVMCLTKEQQNVLVSLNTVFDRATELGIDFIYDYSIRKMVAFNAENVNVEMQDNINDDKDVYIDFESRIEDYDSESDEWFCEVGRETYYHEPCYDGLVIIPKH